MPEHNEIKEELVAVAAKSSSSAPAIIALLIIILIYAGLVVRGIPQKWTQESIGGHSASEAVEKGTVSDVSDTNAENTTVAENGEGMEEATEEVPPLWTIIPFCVLLLCIAILPLIPAVEHWWESNLHRFWVAGGLGVLMILYYAFMCKIPVACEWPGETHVLPSAGPFAMGSAVFINAIINDFIPFIVLLFALFTISGGIRITGNLKAKPLTNSIFLMIGAVLASFVGTTGAAMLLIRPLLETNKERKYKIHTVIFFIFCVCNCGGCLLPIGDPPLFLGYLRGVNFLWTFNLWKEWLFVNGIMILLYYFWDSCWYYRREPVEEKVEDAANQQGLKILGLWPNLFCLIGVVLSVMFLAPTKAIGEWYPWMFLREIVQLLMVLISLVAGSQAIRIENKFNYAAIIEVAALFFGIFLCMQAPLQILKAKGGDLSEAVNKCASKIGLSEAQQFFWMTGSLSSVLDNAPTYVVFFQTAKSAAEDELQTLKQNNPEEAEKMEAEMTAAEKTCGIRIPLKFLVAISIGAVFMGSMTYIGNGPNFMVKSIAEESGVKMPSFFGYMGYSICLLFPVLLIMTLIFLA